ncbi:LexA family protein [Leptospira kmetyi]|uniref:LexA family protein n=1 Tax=Leptospira kmetyi TaxID=408139 RepID=UPI000F641653
MNFHRNHSFSSKLSPDRVYPFISPVRAGFQSPATEYLEGVINPLDLLLRNPDSSFFARVLGDSMKDVFVRNDDLLIIDRSLEPRNGNVVVCTLGGTFLTKILRVEGKKWTLVSGNPNYPPIPITRENEFELWGVGAWSCHNLLGGGWGGVRSR